MVSATAKIRAQCDPTQTASDITIRDCEFHNITVRAVYLEGIPDTATNTRSSGKLNYVLLDGNTTWNCAQHFHVSGGDAITNLTVSRNRAIRPVTSPGNDYYGLVITDVDGLMVDNNNFHLCSRGISLTDATNAAIIGNTLTATVDAIPITLAGTNTGAGRRWCTDLRGQHCGQWQLDW
jgi:parallel beta-helix repeat protein